MLDSFVPTTSASVLGAVGGELGANLVKVGDCIDHWLNTEIDKQVSRQAIGRAAKNTLGGWFKKNGYGDTLARVVVSAWQKMQGTPFATSLTQIKKWVYGG